jgi:hypothetical protein
MTFKILTLHDSTMLRITIRTGKAENIALKVYNDSQKDTYFMDRTKMIDGTEDLLVRMPLSPYTTTIKVYNVANGDQRKGVDRSFDVLSIRQEELEKTISRTKMDIPIVKNFVSFAQKFAYNAGWLPPKDYSSVVGGFKIEYLPHITNLQTGAKMSTPARVSTKNGRIQVSQEAFVPMTVPMRMAILLHEFSHYYLNSDIANETEADLNGLTIYLGLGYPIREAFAAFGDTFIGHPSAQNKIRYDIINKFIKDYIQEYNIRDVYAK